MKGRWVAGWWVCQARGTGQWAGGGACQPFQGTAATQGTTQLAVTVVSQAESPERACGGRSGERVSGQMGWLAGGLVSRLNISPPAAMPPPPHLSSGALVHRCPIRCVPPARPPASSLFCLQRYAYACSLV